MKNINDVFEILNGAESQQFSVSMSETGFVIDPKSRDRNSLLGAFEILDQFALSDTKNAYVQFEKVGMLYQDTRDRIIDILEISPTLECNINMDSYNLLSNFVQKFGCGDTTISIWVDADEEVNYILVNSVSEEQFGLISGILYFCKVDTTD